MFHIYCVNYSYTTTPSGIQVTTLYLTLN